jgi:tRNA dimethylallyltransferase
VVCGGTGLYLRAALADLNVPPAVGPEARERVAREVDDDRDAAHRRLTALDPAAAEAVHPHDRKRLVRALELADEGTSLVANQHRLWNGETRRPTLIVGLDVTPDVLERRIRERAEAMFARGVVDEVRAALSGPVSHTAEKTLGLAEIAELGPDALEPIVARTRRYAAYQRKWMRRIPDLVLLDGTRAPGELADEIVELA